MSAYRARPKIRTTTNAAVSAATAVVDGSTKTSDALTAVAALSNTEQPPQQPEQPPSPTSTDDADDSPPSSSYSTTTTTSSVTTTKVKKQHKPVRSGSGGSGSGSGSSSGARQRRTITAAANSQPVASSVSVRYGSASDVVGSDDASVGLDAANERARDEAILREHYLCYMQKWQGAVPPGGRMQYAAAAPPQFTGIAPPAQKPMQQQQYMPQYNNNQQHSAYQHHYQPQHHQPHQQQHLALQQQQQQQPQHIRALPTESSHAPPPPQWTPAVAMPLVSTVVFFIITLGFTGVLNAYANARRLLHQAVNSNGDGGGVRAARLPDVMFDVLPAVHNNWWPNALTYGLIALVAVALLAHRRRLTLVRRLLFCWGSLLCMRCTTVALTTLPDPNHMCYGSANPIEDQLMSFVSGISCGDMIFSGHTVAMVCCAFSLSEAYPHWHPFTGKLNRWWTLVHTACFVWVTAGVTSLLVTRFHYTVDVVLAVYFALLVCVLYRVLISDERRVHSWPSLAWYEQDRMYVSDMFRCQCARNHGLLRLHPATAGAAPGAAEPVLVLTATKSVLDATNNNNSGRLTPNRGLARRTSGGTGSGSEDSYELGASSSSRTAPVPSFPWPLTATAEPTSEVGAGTHSATGSRPPPA